MNGSGERQLGLGVVGLHEGLTMLVAAATRTKFVRAVAGCDRRPEKVKAARLRCPDLSSGGNNPSQGKPLPNCAQLDGHYHGMHYGEFANYADYFAQGILEDRPCSPEMEEGIETFAVMEAIRQSAVGGGRVVAIDPLLAEVGLRKRRE